MSRTVNCFGTQVGINAYDEHGVPASANAGRFGYTGQAWIPELGMYYYKARIYAPALGRFMQTDPVGYKDQVNLYEYVGDDPVDGRDPSGDQAEGEIDSEPAPDAEPAPSSSSPGQRVERLEDEREMQDPASARGAQLRQEQDDLPRSLRPSLSKDLDKLTDREAGKFARNLPRPPTGPGRVPREQRAPKRSWSAAERAAEREAQGGRCGNGCGRAIDDKNSQGHHIERHSDGGRTNDTNHAEVCLKCHTDLHSGNGP